MASETCPFHVSLEARCVQAERERDEARETIKRLNKRLQSAESGLAAMLRGEATPDGKLRWGLGRALANAAATLYQARAERLECIIRAVKDFLVVEYAFSGLEAAAHGEAMPVEARTLFEMICDALGEIDSTP